MSFEMNMLWACLFLPAGLLILLKGADVLVDGAVALARRFGVSPLIIGLTIIAMGTSAPEIATCITAAAKNLGNTAIGNVYGSNIANLALVGGLCAIISPINIKLTVLRREMPAMLIVGLLLWPVLANLHLGRAEGITLLILFAILIIVTVLMEMQGTRSRPAEVDKMNRQIHSKTGHPGKNIFANIALIVIGLIALALGADLAVQGGVFIGYRAGLSETVIGLTIIAIGTSLPELVTCVVAALKGHDDISIGTLLGSNIFNVLLAIGCAGLIKPFDIAKRLIGVDYWVMIIVSTAFMLIAIINKRISRSAGAILVATYVVYIAYLLILTKTI